MEPFARGLVYNDGTIISPVSAQTIDAILTVAGIVVGAIEFVQ
jgi:hypothetical protein